MLKFKDVIFSSIGRKFLNGVTALALVIFVIGHLGGNLTLLLGPEAFNAYAEKLHALGGLLYVAEVLLLLAIVVHAGLGVKLTVENIRGRSQGYRAGQSSKDGPSNFNWSSTTMIWSGLLLLFFLFIHIIQFRLRPYWDKAVDHEYYHELYGLVDQAFAQPIWVIFYSVIMVFLGFHLRHGIWSMFQTIGAMNSRWKQSFYGFALLAALVLALGFLILPAGMYFNLFPLGG